MYYAEQMINGMLHFKTSPKGDWKKFNELMLMTRIVELEQRLLVEFNKESNPLNDAAPAMYEMLEDLIKLGTELLNVEDVECEEDAATIHSNFNDKIIQAALQLKKARVDNETESK